MSWSDVADGPTTTILPRNVPALEPIVRQTVAKDVVSIVPAGPTVVDPRRVAIAELLPGDRLARRPLGRDEGEALELVDLESHSPDDAARVEREVPVADSRTDVADDLVAAEDVRAPPRPTSVVARTRLPAFATDSTRAMSSAISVSSVNWTS